ncbi:MAG TPA: biotin/lipoyl-containing protein, partial [Bacillaceae bacterium]
MKEIVSSMAGTVFNVLVSEGDTVESGQTVLILESMKMEIPI